MTRKVILLSLTIITLAAACSSSTGGNQPGQAVEGYLQALVEEDLNGMISHSCADWEAQAKLEFDSFYSVELELNQVACSQTGSDGSNTALVSCTGSIIANYGAEDLEIDVAERPYRVVLEAGEWRMCGYGQP